MNVGVFATEGDSRLTGIQRVTVDTMRELLKIDAKNQYFKLEGEYYDLPIIKDAKEWLLLGMNYPNQMDFICKAHKIDVLYSFFPDIPVTYPCKKVLTIHDVIPLIHPEWFTKEMYQWFNEVLRKSALEADKIIAMSETTKQDIMRHYGVEEDKIKVIYSGIQPSILAKCSCVDIKKKFGISGKYILSVCTLEPRKNLKGLINAFLEYKRKYSDSDLQLVLTGKIGWEDETVEFIKSNEKYHEDIILTDFVSGEELALLMEKALAMAYVSFYEGFGLPILEGMAAGKAVISSDTSSMPEVGGDAVIYCNPYDRESIVNAIERVVEDEDYRKQIEQRAKQRAITFSYERTAKQVLEVLEEVVNVKR